MISEAPSPALVRRNTILLAATLTCLSGMLQLVVAVSTITLVLVTGIESILGLGPAGVPGVVGGRRPSRPGGRWTGIGACRSLATAARSASAGASSPPPGAGLESAPLVLVGFVMVGGSSGTVLLVRAAAADLYPPERRARGISYVLFGSLFGAALGPLVFRPLLSGRHLDSGDLVIPYLAAGAIMAVGFFIVLQVRPDPKVFAAATARAHPDHASGPPPPLSEVLARPGTIAAVIAAVTSFAVMVSVMNLAGYVVVGHGHAEADIFTVISFHIIGMYSLVLVVGDMIDRVGRMPALVGGLLVMGGVGARPGLALERALDVVLPLRGRPGLERVLRRGVRPPGRRRGTVRARPPDRLHRSPLGLHGRRAGARGRRRLLGVRRARDRDRSDADRDRADPAHAGAPAAARRRLEPSGRVAAAGAVVIERRHRRSLSTTAE